MKPGENRYYHLDLRPEVKINNGHKYKRNARHKWGPDKCFCEEGLYALKLGNWSSDQIEQKFFGGLDSNGRKAVRLFGEYSGTNDQIVESFQSLLLYLDAQRFRTPRGLDFILSQDDQHDRNRALRVMQRLFQIYSTIWAEGVWEIVYARQSPTKFIVSDNPVTLYNSGIFPHEIPYPLDVRVEGLGTRTLFPLGSTSCLIITHLQLVRNPRIDPLESRINPRTFQPTMKSLLDIQYGRELDEDEVVKINYILKRRATRYIAAAEEHWLYPEKYASTRIWSKLDDDWFLLPNPYKVSFNVQMMVGFNDGSAWGMDEFGRLPRKDIEAEESARRARGRITKRQT
ncbi:MAG TPA: hypothetical protein VMH89_03505, partial [Candidatus Acidoferrum sp.]|nr:hypothetical protein [Candidatus Acidoferrum sp.]